MAKAKLTQEQRLFAVQSLACFDSPSLVAKMLREEFGVSITPQSVETYDPTKRAGRKCAKRWREIFEKTRQEFLKDTARIGISHRAVRLRALSRMAEQAEKMGNIGLAAQIYEQAAKECGEAYTNRRELTGKDGGPIRSETTVSLDPSKLSSSALEEILNATTDGD